MVMSDTEKARARERMRAYWAKKRGMEAPAIVCDPLGVVRVIDLIEPPSTDPALIVELELTENQLAALTLDSRCKGLSIPDTILAVINKAYGL